MDWNATFGAMDNSLKAALARKQLEQSGLLDILNTQEGLRRKRASEALQGRQIDEQAAYRAELARQREQEQQALSEQRRALAEKYQHDVESQQQNEAARQALVEEWATATPERKRQIEFKLRAQYNANLPAAENAGNDFMAVSPGATVFSKSQGKAIFHAPDRPTKAGAGVTPAQRMAAHMQALRLAAQAARDGSIPDGADQAAYARQLEQENLMSLGVDVNPEDAQWRGKATTAPGDIDLSGGGAPAPAPPPSPAAEAKATTSADQAAVEFLRSHGKPLTPANIAAVKQRMAAGALQ